MDQSTLKRVWDRLVNRYDPETGDDCCEVGFEDSTAETEDATDSCCE